MPLQMYEFSKDMSILKRIMWTGKKNPVFIGICGSMLKMKNNVSFPLNVILCCSMTIHLARFIQNNSIIDLQLDNKTFQGKC